VAFTSAKILLQLFASARPAETAAATSFAAHTPSFALINCLLAAKGGIVRTQNKRSQVLTEAATNFLATRQRDQARNSLADLWRLGKHANIDQSPFQEAKKNG